ncbi:MAG: hypothetical protein ABJR46_01180 [Tateyamaria sp.]|uniref:hypothetical protein n=1 Tax=Tateyamaria sp. TaxID=1929288 RepID=UPI0032A000AC
METEDSIKLRSDRVQKALEDAFGVRAKTVSRAVRKAGRRLPRGLRADAARIVAAEGCGGNPKLLRTIDGAALDTATDRLEAWLDTVDRADARRGYWTGIGAMIGFNILLIGGLVVIWMWWTGRV